MRAPLLLALMLIGCSGSNIKGPTGGGDGTKDTGPQGAMLEISVDSVDFGEVDYQDLLQETITVSNPGTVDLLISSITTEDPFTVAPGFMTLIAGGFSTLTVFVQPQTYEDFSSNITLVTDDADVGTVMIPLIASTIRDVDGDGYDTIAAGGDDCDDTDASVNPDAEETWYDDVDSNCDGGNDFDQDGDGYDAETDDHEVPRGMADCNDTNVDYNPGAVDEPYDNRDTNCDDANDWDYDGDGFEVPSHGGSDCDDYDATANRDGIEAFDGKDDDCDDVADNNAYAYSSPYVYTSSSGFSRTGYSIAIGDLNADGVAELIVGAPYDGASSPSGNGNGGVGVFDGPSLLPTGTEVDRADNWFDGNAAADLLGTYVSVIGDYDGDGENDLAVGAQGVSSNSGAVYILAGDDARRGDLSDAMATYTGTSSSYFGRGIGTDIDLNADGMADLVVMGSSGGSNAVALQYGGASATSTTVNGMDAKWSTDGAESAFYRNAPVGGDLDGDGYDDLVLSDGVADVSTTNDGAMWVIWGRSSEYAVTTMTDIESTATVAIRGTTSSDYVAWSTQLGDDWDGDGDNELWVYNAAEALYVIEGGTNRRSTFSPADAASVTYTWENTDAEMIRRAGDWDGDGVSEMLVFLEDESGEYGRSEMFSSSIRSGVYNEEDDRIGNLLGDTTYGNGNVGWGMAPMGGDLDGDGDSDMAVGDTEFDSNGGEVYVLINETGTGE